MKARQIVTSGLLAALVFALKVAMAGLPNIEPVTLLLIMYTLHLPKLALYITFVYIFLEAATFGLGMWTVNYLYIWPLLLLLTWLLRRNRSAIVWATFSGAFGLCYGALCAIPWAVTGGIYAGLSYWVSGIPYDIAHCIGNAVLMLVLYKPLQHCFSAVAKYIDSQK